MKRFQYYMMLVIVLSVRSKVDVLCVYIHLGISLTDFVEHRSAIGEFALLQMVNIYITLHKKIENVEEPTLL